MVVIMKLLNELGRRMDEHSEDFNKELKYKEEANKDEEYNKLKKIHERNQQQIRLYRESDQQIERQCRGNHLS